MKIFKRHWYKFIVVLFYFGLAYCLLRVFHIDYLKIKDMDPHFIRENIKVLGAWIPLFFTAFYILRPLVLFPATILSILGGIIFGYFWGIVLVLLGAMLSAITEFFLSRHYGRGLAMELFGNNLLRIDNVVKKNGFLSVFLIRLIPNVAFDIQNFSLGLSEIKFRDYFFGTLFGIIPVNFIYVYLGCSFLDLTYLWRAILILLVLLAAYYLVNKFIKIAK